MNIREYAFKKATGTAIGRRLAEDQTYRIITKAVCSLIFNLLFAFYNGILGVLSSSLIFLASSAYYFLLSAMRFAAVTVSRKRGRQNSRLIGAITGVMLIALSVIFSVMVFASVKYHTAALHGTIPMITIATFTFTKITAAAITAVKHRKEAAGLFKAINAIRYSEVAVSLLTMQQSMLVSFGDDGDAAAVILNACTGGAVCLFIMVLGIHTLRSSRKEKNNGTIKNRKSK